MKNTVLVPVVFRYSGVVMMGSKKGGEVTAVSAGIFAVVVRSTHANNNQIS